MMVFASNLLGENVGPYRFNLILLAAWVLLFAIFDIRPKKMKERQDP